MPQRALAERRPFLMLSLLAGISYYFVADEPLGGLWLMLWKGAGVGFLALYAARRGYGTDAVLLTCVMALSALADIVLEVSFLIGGAVFALAHSFAIALYWRNRRATRSLSQNGAAAALLVLVPAIAALLTYPLPNWSLAAGYAAIVAAMAASAWISRFPRYRVGLGAILFVASDLFIFAGEAGAVGTEAARLLIWPLYYAGQVLIATGVVGSMRNAAA